VCRDAAGRAGVSEPSQPVPNPLAHGASPCLAVCRGPDIARELAASLLTGGALNSAPADLRLVVPPAAPPPLATRAACPPAAQP
jgi:hypothetical protein